MNAEQRRLNENKSPDEPWHFWGPYLAERAWGTVREDYSPNGDAWNYFPHDHARSRAYRWNEDGLGGISDHKGRLCFAFALWNERDPFLKERIFGVSGPEGNHGEDVKDLYWYVDNTPSHSFMRMIYRYPQSRFPYEELVAQSREKAPETAQIVLPPGPRLGDLVVEADHVGKGYGDRVLIDDLGFKLPRGGIVGVIGPNGAGKTTALRLMAGLLQPDSGRIFFDDRDVTSLPAHARVRLGLGFTHQIVRPFYSFSSIENVMIAAGHRHTTSPWRALTRRSRQAARERAAAILERDHRVHVRPSRPWRNAGHRSSG